jgi:hypothetical protein
MVARYANAEVDTAGYQGQRQNVAQYKVPGLESLPVTIPKTVSRRPAMAQPESPAAWPCEGSGWSSILV